MTLEEVVILIVMAAVLGILSQRLLGYKLGGLVISIVLGFIGAFLGRLIGQHVPVGFRFHLQIGDTSFPVLWSLLGCLAATFVAGFIAKSASKQQKKKS
jgi:uncharacterized membrane protein YeaQ/YmgE (transglycosylase-associated protein family)